MRNSVRAAAGVLAAGVLAAGLSYGTASAGGEDRIEGTGTFALGTFDFNARSTGDSDDDVTGYFEADATSPGDAFVHLEGSVTCLVVDGNKAGFIYPVEEGSMPGAIAGSTAVFITLEDGGEGGTDHVGFMGPAPEAAFPGCAPGLAPFEVTEGDVEVTDED